MDQNVRSAFLLRKKKKKTKEIGRDREYCMLMLEMYSSPQGGFFFDYVNDET